MFQYQPGFYGVYRPPENMLHLRKQGEPAPIPKVVIRQYINGKRVTFPKQRGWDLMCVRICAQYAARGEAVGDVWIRFRESEYMVKFNNNLVYFAKTLGEREEGLHHFVRQYFTHFNIRSKRPLSVRVEVLMSPPPVFAKLVDVLVTQSHKWTSFSLSGPAGAFLLLHRGLGKYEKEGFTTCDKLTAIKLDYQAREYAPPLPLERMFVPHVTSLQISGTSGYKHWPHNAFLDFVKRCDLAEKITELRVSVGDMTDLQLVQLLQALPELRVLGLRQEASWFSVLSIQSLCMLLMPRPIPEDHLFELVPHLQRLELHGVWDGNVEEAELLVDFVESRWRSKEPLIRCIDLSYHTQFSAEHLKRLREYANEGCKIIGLEKLESNPLPFPFTIS
ncbi:hypothetical protein FISHEDRAFT_55339 [Fistulina hepatica ATCC 64428]|uniref:Uncharacterized protein n=1 Tax=Fistulina hepatica ATCC 64428 TaxID=1128425 RepID=A0A0D7AR38_9AGAR|nr:hypothetical protein FISHEDRAFT_55339 [Fistulina hepatica ATCC 64428]